MNKRLGWFGLLVAGWQIFNVSAEPSDELLAKLQPRGHVNDFAGVFTTQQVVSAESFLNGVETNTTAEIVLVTLKSLEGGEIDDMANRLYAQWGIGKKGRDNGALLLAAIEDRKMRIEVGYGLEGLVTDARAGRIMDERVIPRFREGQFADGLIDGAKSLAALIAEDAAIASPTNSAIADSAPQTVSPAGLVFILLFVAVFVWIVIVAVRKGKSSGPGGGRPGSSSGGGNSGSSGGSFSGSSSHSFGGGRSGGGGAGRSW